MVNLPFLALVFLLIVAFLIGLAFGATLKNPTDNSEKRDIPDISDWKPSINEKIKLIKPLDAPIRRTGDEIIIDPTNWKISIDKGNDLINLRDELNKRAGDKKD